MAILVERSGKETEVPVPDGCLSVTRARKVWDEPFPLLRTAATFFDGPKFHFVEDQFVLHVDGRFHFWATSDDRTLAESIAMVGGAAGAMERACGYRCRCTCAPKEA